MYNTTIQLKALRILQNLISLRKINKLLLPLNTEFEIKDNPFQFFSTLDYYPIVYEETIALLIELSINVRRELEQLKKFKGYIKFKYPNVGKFCKERKDISFEKILSKIIHSNNIELQTKDQDGNLFYGYEGKRENEFTGLAVINGTDRDNNPYSATVDIYKICVNCFMIDAFKSC